LMGDRLLYRALPLQRHISICYACF
jgi:hypothetical protein